MCGQHSHSRWNAAVVISSPVTCAGLGQWCALAPYAACPLSTVVYASRAAPMPSAGSWLAPPRLSTSMSPARICRPPSMVSCVARAPMTFSARGAFRNVARMTLSRVSVPWLRPWRRRSPVDSCRSALAIR
ncbi:hypothetical protein ADK57_17715 [Streptomyces sp. MMG1533]|nr:hypothetical protein ADK57_17715 [Streptomyces sp. MMG1533]